MDGILIIDKPQDWTSHDVVARARGILKTRRIGHTGTLDPFATGVLVLCIGRYTRLVQFLGGDDKEYHAVMRLGHATDTGDLTGVALEPQRDPAGIGRNQIEDALVPFRGCIQQVPPMYAAKKIGGVKLYEMARRGEVVERQPVPVKIKELELLPAREDLPESDIPFRVVCSAGTYIRTLAEEIGQRLGVGAHLVELRRTRAGACSIANALSLGELEREVSEGRLATIFQQAASILGLPAAVLDERTAALVQNGMAISSGGSRENTDERRILLCLPNGMPLAIAEWDSEKEKWQPRVVLAGNSD